MRFPSSQVLRFTHDRFDAESLPTYLGIQLKFQREIRVILGWWFHIFFIFIPKIGEDEPILTIIFSLNGLKPPTRFVFVGFFGEILVGFSLEVNNHHLKHGGFLLDDHKPYFKKWWDS